jgi:hypothetical protein
MIGKLSEVHCKWEREKVHRSNRFFIKPLCAFKIKEIEPDFLKSDQGNSMS